MKSSVQALLLGCVVLLCYSHASEEKSWGCIDVKASKPLTASGSATWSRFNCSDTADPPLLVVNVLEIDLLAKDIRIMPGVSNDAAATLAPVPDIAASNPTRNFIAGINGGYFWRTWFYRDLH